MHFKLLSCCFGGCFGGGFSGIGLWEGPVSSGVYLPAGTQSCPASCSQVGEGRMHFKLLISNIQKPVSVGLGLEGGRSGVCLLCCGALATL